MCLISVENTCVCPIFAFGLGWVFYSSCKVNKEEVVERMEKELLFLFLGVVLFEMRGRDVPPTLLCVSIVLLRVFPLTLSRSKED